MLSARLEDAVDGVEQLFTSTSADPGHRQMLVPARWPDVTESAVQVGRHMKELSFGCERFDC